MKASRLMLRASGFCMAVALLAGCGGSSNAPGVTPQNQAIMPHTGAARSWMLPEAKGADLLYLSGFEMNDVYVYTYPKLKLVGTLTGFDGPAWPCSDENGNVWIPNYNAANIVEYAHGGTNPITTLSDPNLFPQNCSVDPTTGNLAVVGYAGGMSSGGIAVYPRAQGSPKIYPVDFAITSFCSYDANGNLFVDGFGYNEQPPFAFGVIPKGGSAFKAITLHPTPYQPFNVQWDGKYVATGDAASIYRFAIHGTKAVKRGTLHLNVIHMIGGFWIQGSKIVVTNRFGQGTYPAVLLYRYPRGGNPVKTGQGTDFGLGPAVSLAPK